MTLSSQSDQKLGSLAVRVKSSMVNSLGFRYCCCCYGLGRGSVVVGEFCGNLEVLRTNQRLTNVSQHTTILVTMS